ncbi:ubiquitin carboxyl-terminal hydrolase 36-like [Lethenteron reissneri]|uniref:ubiquitin carboxyl-terminal hydrolase 36-like n=1 Tax=Lethenteron reissneri TaxID=7753 RepID=UPI002AB775D5|nr:ubiquitin carboxyl-terminal hydrolase 36-like [Lethenteron reissneri]
MRPPEGTSSGNDLTVLAPTSSNEVLAAADERLCSQPSCLPHGLPEPSPVPATARENISVSVLPAPQDDDPREGSRGAVPGTPSPDEARGAARVAVPELTGAAQAAAGPQGTSSGNDLTVLAPTSSNEVLVAADEWLCTQPCCLPHGRPEPSPVPATENISVSVPAPQEEDDGIPAARLSLFAPERLNLRWESDVCKGAGLRNLGNTCFLNATLQCLAYTPPLANYLLLQEHCSTCQQSDFCLMCVMEHHIVSTFNNSQRVLTPKVITKNITRESQYYVHTCTRRRSYPPRSFSICVPSPLHHSFCHICIAKHLRIGRQEDAHEFLRYVVDGMQASCLYGHSELDRYTEATTLIYQIFGGYLRSRVECMQCCNHSDTFDTCLDIALHINNSSDLVEAFEEFFNKETLDEYTCGMCCCKGEATKTMALHRLPNVLTVSIKRYNLYGVKINRNITYPEHLDMQPFTSTSQGEPAIYSLYSVLVHKGANSNRGHYYCYNKISDGQWCCMNDSNVRHVDTKAVMNKQAYVLFYIRSPELNAPPAESYCPLEHVKATSWSCLKRPHSAKEDPGPSYRTAALLTGAQETQDVGPPQREQLPEPLQVRRQEQQQQQLPATPDTQQPLPLVPEQPPPPPRSHSSRCHSTSNHRQSYSSHHHHRRRSHRSRRQHHSSCCHRVSHSSQSNSSQSNSSQSHSSQSNSSQSNSSHRHQSHHSHRHSGRTAATTGVTTGTRPTKISRWLKSMITCLTSCFPSRSN